jgi:hypothetical protein
VENITWYRTAERHRRNALFVQTLSRRVDVTGFGCVGIRAAGNSTSITRIPNPWLVPVLLSKRST